MNSKRPPLLQGPLWVTGFIGFTLLIVCGAAYMAILREDAANPRAHLFADLWPAVAVGGTSAEAVEQMGPPDVEVDAPFLVTPAGRWAQLSSDEVSSVESGLCVRKLTWHSWQERGSGKAYSVCVDDDDVVLDKRIGMVFQLTNW